MVKAKVFITGQVIGVGFRYWVFGLAKKFKLVGWVRNVDQLGVEAVFQGDEEKVKAMLKLCRQGPPTAWVKKVKVSCEPIEENLTDFKIQRF